MPSLVYVNVNDKEEGKDDKEGKDDEESFLSQVHEKLCSSDRTSLDIGSHSPSGVHNVTSTPSPCHAGRPDSLEFMKQPSSWSVSHNETNDPVT